MAITDAHQLLRAFCDELVRCGMRTAVTTPGSRNTPILSALAHEPGLAAYSHVDERCAGFFALGAAKASGRPVALTCTSGTAAANLAPAVIEASHARVPLIILTADRPPELRDIGAGQAIDQLHLYGRAVRWFFELGVQDASVERLRWIRALACRAYWTALGPVGGPVHINVPLREPLTLDGPLPDDPLPGRPHGAPWVARGAPGAPIGAPAPTAERPVLVAGSGAPGSELGGPAAAAGIPLLADPMSGGRRGPAAVAHYDLLLRSDSFTRTHIPDLVVRIGELPTSKPLRRWLAELDADQVAVDPEGLWHDPDSVVSRRVPALAAPAAPASAGWLGSWRRADAAVAAAIGDTLGGRLSEPAVAAALHERLPGDALLYVAASMPVRDLEEFAAARDDPPRVLANRGANGIDGTVSSAFGAAAVHPGPVVLLIGDVALLHDLGGLLAAQRSELSLTVVVLNNDGGGIFEFLPVAGQADIFEAHVATPHGLELAHAAALFGLRYRRVDTLEELQGEIVAPAGATLLEVRTDRRENVVLHRQLAAASLRAVDALRSPG